MNVKTLVLALLRAALALLYKLVRTYAAMGYLLSRAATVLAVVFAVAGIGWWPQAAGLAAMTALHYGLIRLADYGYFRGVGALQRRRFA